MATYITRRLLSMIIVLMGVATLVFFMLHLVPGDPAAVMLGMRASEEQIQSLRSKMGLDQPLFTQYTTFLLNLARGDLGRSIRSNRSVIEEITSRIVPTFLLAFWGMGIAVVLGVLAGVVAAANRNSIIETLVMVVATLGVSVPSFVLAMLLVMVFSLQLGLFPAIGYGTISHLVLPAISLGFLYSCLIARVTRSSIIEILNQDYVTVSRAKGLRERIVLFKHALRNAIIPVITIAGVYFGILLGGTIVIEHVFNWPGLGTLALNSILTRDFPVTRGVVLLMGISFSVINLIVDLLYAYIDPRIRYD